MVYEPLHQPLNSASAFVAILLLPTSHRLAGHREVHVVSATETPGSATRARHLTEDPKMDDE